jgi:hypothetical protein
VSGPTDPHGDAPDPAGPPEDDLPLSAALREASKVGRRRVLRAAAAVGAIAALGGGGALLYGRRARAKDADDGRARARAAEDAIARGEVRLAKKLAEEARALDPTGRAEATSWIRAASMEVLDGDTGKDAAVALLAETRRLGARGLELALASLAAAVGVKNDHLVEKILAEHAEAEIAKDAAHLFAEGAGLDLLCDPESARRYREASELWGGRSLVANVRHARALLFAGKVDDARALVAKLPKEGREATVLSALADRVALLAGAALKPAWVDPKWVTELPRSLRTLATAMALADPNAPAGQSAGLDAALDDVDTPLAALLAGRIALAAGDRVSAKAAADCALRMRAELDAAKVFSARLALVDGDLGRARELAGEGPDKATVLMVQAIDAYERGDKGRVGEIDAESANAPDRWGGLGFARALLEGGEPPKATDLDAAIAKSEPWADLLAVDAALRAHDVDRAKKLALAWADGPLTEARKQRKKRIEAPQPDTPEPPASGSAKPPAAPAPPAPSAPRK